MLYTVEEVIDRVIAWAYDRNLPSGSTPIKQVNKTSEEVNELVAALGAMAVSDDDALLEEAADAIGDITVTLIIIAEQLGLTFENCLRSAYEEIKDRKGKMINGIFVKEAE